MFWSFVKHEFKNIQNLTSFFFLLHGNNHKNVFSRNANFWVTFRPNPSVREVRRGGCIHNYSGNNPDYSPLLSTNIAIITVPPFIYTIYVSPCPPFQSPQFQSYILDSPPSSRARSFCPISQITPFSSRAHSFIPISQITPPLPEPIVLALYLRTPPSSRAHCFSPITQNPPPPLLEPVVLCPSFQPPSLQALSFSLPPYVPIVLASLLKCLQFQPPSLYAHSFSLPP